MRKMRSKRGGAIVFGVVLALALVVLGCGFLLFSMFMGGQSETKNAVDAGTLNVGRKALDQVGVPLTTLDELSFFDDCTINSTNNNGDDTKSATLRNINRIWAKALLLGINADAAQADNQAGSMAGNANSAFSAAQTLSNALADKLTDQNNLHGFFDDYAGANSTRMVGTKSQTKTLAGPNWQTSFMNRNDESNISLGGQPPNFNLPPGYSLDSSAYTQCTRTPVPSGAAGQYFLKGYSSITAANNTYWFVPFLYDEKPYLVASSTFGASTLAANPLGWNKPIPNGFSAEGATTAAGIGEKATAWVLTNPREPFQLSMPHAFLHIHIDDMTSKWFFFPLGFPIEDDPEIGYNYIPDPETNLPSEPGGVLCSSVTPDEVVLGLDVVGKTLDGIIFGYPEGDKTSTENYVTNRMNEMISVPGKSLSVSDMHNALSTFASTGELVAGIRDFYVYSKDGQTISVNPEPLAIADAPWLLPFISNTPDGEEKKIIDDASDFGEIFFFPIVAPLPGCTPLPPLGWGTYEKDVNWTPGSGYNGCLGQIRVTRWTDVYSLGACNPF